MIDYQLLSCSQKSDSVQALDSFFREAYGERSSFKYPSRWSWLYGRQGSLAALALDESRIIGFVGAMAMKVMFSGKSVPAAWSVDNFVLPDYRSRGIGTALQRNAESSIPVTLSTWLSAGNAEIKKRLGNLMIGDLTILSLGTAQKRSSNCEVSEPNPVLIASMAKLAMARYDLCVDRNVEYCRWRFQEQPLAAYVQLSFDCGISLVRKCGPQRDKVGMIGDVFSAAGDLTEAVELVECSAGWLLAEGCERVRFGTSDPDLIRLLEQSDARWKTRGRHAVMVSEPGSYLARCSLPFFSLSDSDLDQYPW